MPGVSRPIAMAGRFSLSRLWKPSRLAYNPKDVEMPSVRPANLGHIGNDLPPNSSTIAAVVESDMVDDQPEGRCECSWSPKDSRLGELSHSMADAPKAQARDGASWTG